MTSFVYNGLFQINERTVLPIFPNSNVGRLARSWFVVGFWPTCRLRRLARYWLALIFWPSCRSANPSSLSLCFVGLRIRRFLSLLHGRRVWRGRAVSSASPLTLLSSSASVFFSSSPSLLPSQLLPVSARRLFALGQRLLLPDSGDFGRLLGLIWAEVAPAGFWGFLATSRAGLVRPCCLCLWPAGANALLCGMPLRLFRVRLSGVALGAGDLARAAANPAIMLPKNPARNTMPSTADSDASSRPRGFPSWSWPSCCHTAHILELRSCVKRARNHTKRLVLVLADNQVANSAVHGVLTGQFSNDEHDKFLGTSGASAMTVKGISDPATLEAMACAEALVLAQDLGFSQLLASSDYLEVINMMKSSNSCSYIAILGEVEKLSRNDVFKLQHESRESNGEAHLVTRNSVSDAFGRRCGSLNPDAVPLFVQVG